LCESAPDRSVRQAPGESSYVDVSLEDKRPAVSTKPSPFPGLYGPRAGARLAPDVPAHAASEGTLITLALLTALCSPNRPRILLLDDIDQSLHPQ
jgi:hypothetical protein